MAGTSPAMTAAVHAARLPLRAEPERLSASRPRLFGAVEFRFGARKRRALPAAHRGYRRRPLPAGIRGRDLRRPRLARDGLGNPGAAAIGASFRLSRCARKAREPGAGLSELRKPRRDRQTGGGAGGEWALAARSRRGAALSRRGKIALGASALAANRARPTRCGSTWKRPAPGSATSTGSNTARAPTARPGWWPPGRKPGATSSWRARRRRPAITSR